MAIVDKLVFEINAGNYQPDDKLPSENELADLYNVPRLTARKAYKRLQELDYIYSIQGKGSFVKNRWKQIPLMLSGNQSFSQKMQELGYDYRSVNIGCELVSHHQNICQALGAGQTVNKVYKISRLRYVDGRPIALHNSFVSEALFPNIADEGRAITSMFNYYKSEGHVAFASSESRLSVAFPSRTERELLECCGLVPLLILDSDCVDAVTGHVLEVTRILYRSDYFTYMI